MGLMLKDQSRSTTPDLRRKLQMKTRYYRQKALGPVKWLAYETGQTKWVPPPDRMYIESTNFCNLSCVMCPTGRDEVTRTHGFMDFDMFKAIVDEMAPHVKATTLHIWGEPLMHKRIFDMIAYCRDHGLRSEISTNATLLDEKKARKLLDAGLDAIYLCLDGMRPETYEKVRVDGDFAKTNANIRRFIQMKLDGGYKKPFVNLQIIQLKQTLGEIDEFVQTWTMPGVDRVNVKPFDSWADQIQEISQLRPEELIMDKKRYPCPNLWYHVHIYWNGDLAMCDRDFNSEFSLGNIMVNGKVQVMRAWNGPRMQELRRLHIQHRESAVSPCNNCTEWSWWKPTLFSSQGNKLVQKEPTNLEQLRTNSNPQIAPIMLQFEDFKE